MIMPRQNVRFPPWKSSNVSFDFYSPCFGRQRLLFELSAFAPLRCTTLAIKWGGKGLEG